MPPFKRGAKATVVSGGAKYVAKFLPPPPKNNNKKEDVPKKGTSKFKKVLLAKGQQKPPVKTISINSKNSNKKYKGVELRSTGEGQRGIKVYVVDVPNSNVSYSINPNPHDNRSYNKNNNQQEFYDTLCKNLGEWYDNNDKYPDKIEVKVFGKMYSLEKLKV